MPWITNSKKVIYSVLAQLFEYHQCVDEERQSDKIREFGGIEKGVDFMRQSRRSAITI